MMKRLRRLWHSRDWMLIPLGLAVLIATVWWLVDRRSSESDAPRFWTDWDIAREAAVNAGPTEGMRLSESGFGTVTDAPAVSAAMAPDGWAAPAVQSIAPDLTRFVRAWPREVPLEREPGEGLICTLEGAPRYSGKLVLIDGCLRFQPENSASPGPLVLSGAIGLDRDAENYLALGSAGTPAEYRLRVGEPGGVFLGVGCSMDAPVPVPPELARECGTDEMIRLGTIKRNPVCSAAYLERRRELQRQERETTVRLQRERRACIARTGRETGCPPDIFPTSMELVDPPCRLPAGA